MQVRVCYSWYSSVTVGRASGLGTGLVYFVQFCNSREGEWCRYRNGIVGIVLLYMEGDWCIYRTVIIGTVL